MGIFILKYKPLITSKLKIQNTIKAHRIHSYAMT
jgi:hypothetical protein